MATFRSSATADSLTSTLTINKPTGLVVGDLMLATISENATIGTFTPPSGFTSLANTQLAGTGLHQQTFYKYATSTDVAASNFSWTTNSGVGNHFFGVIGAYQDASNSVIPQVSTASVTTATTSGTLTATGLTPVRASEMLVFLTSSRDATGTITISSPAVATSNPTWSNAYTYAPVTLNKSQSDTATRAQTTATGNATIAYTSGGTSTNVITHFVLLENKIDNTQTPTALRLVFNIPHIILKGIVVLITLGSAVLNSVRGSSWANPDKTSTTWTNIDK